MLATILCAAVPTTTWNKRWGADLGRFRAHRPGRHYGDQWGDPSVSGVRYVLRKLRYGKRIPGNLSKVVERYVRPYVGPDTVALEIGAGGGRWTRYLLEAREIVVVELNDEFFPYLEQRFPDAADKLRFYRTSGYELHGVDSDSVDFVFSFGTFVHIDPEGIDEYLGEIRRAMRPGAVATIQYADRTKRFFRELDTPGYGGFSNMDARKMETLLSRHRFQLVEHDRSLLNHSNVAVFRKPRSSQ
jgi:SAM-dependent methyltransferase